MVKSKKGKNSKRPDGEYSGDKAPFGKPEKVQSVSERKHEQKERMAAKAARKKFEKGEEVEEVKKTVVPKATSPVKQLSKRALRRQKLAKKGLSLDDAPKAIRELMKAKAAQLALKRKMPPTSAPAKPQPLAKKKKLTKKQAAVVEDSDEEEEEPVKPSKPVSKKQPVAKAVPVVVEEESGEDEEELEDEDDELDEEMVEESESDDDVDEQEEDEEEVEDDLDSSKVPVEESINMDGKVDEGDEEEDDEDEEEMEDEDEEEEEEDEDVDPDADLMKQNEDINEHLEAEFEAFPMEEEDKQGIVNMLTQIFFQAKVDLPGIAEALIAQSPFGTVIGPAEDDEEDGLYIENAVHGLISALPLDPTQENVPKYVTQLLKLVSERASKYSVKETRSAFETKLKEKMGLLINERMLNFPTQIVAPAFMSLSKDLAGMDEQFKQVLYVQKIKIGELDQTIKRAGLKFKDRQSLGKAAKKRLAADLISKADVIYDNVEDAELFKLTEGKLVHFDYPIKHEIDEASKFSSIVKDGQKYVPYRRFCIMDAKRFKAFVKTLCTFEA